MGYTTDFWGQVELAPPLTPEQTAYLKRFSETRRMKRDASKLQPDEWMLAAGITELGVDGAYFVGGDGYRGQDGDDSVISYNEPPGQSGWSYGKEEWDIFLARQADEITNNAQPGLWCQWIPTDDGAAIVWDDGEKFYDYVEWMHYLIENFLKRWGITANGEIEWQGEDSDDRGVLVVKDNVVKTGHYTLVGPTFDG